VSVIHGDCLEVMATLDAESIDAIVTDPPYGLGFMGKAWDGADIAKRAQRRAEQGQDSLQRAMPGRKPRLSMAEAAGQYDLRPAAMRAYQGWCHEWAREALRVAKPGAYLLTFGGTRTIHRMTCAIEDAGWIIRDMLVWAYASGFPKGKANLKPAWEPIVMARKPGPLRPLAIDACRIEAGADLAAHNPHTVRKTYTGSEATINPGDNGQPYDTTKGRWPANVILTETPDGGGIFDGGWDGVVGGGESAPRGNIAPTKRNVVTDGWGHIGGGPDGPIDPGDSGTYSRFFLIPKAARSDREPVLGGLPERAFGFSGGAAAAAARGEAYDLGGMNKVTHRANVHPTVKPTELMRHLVRLVTPPGGVVLDPFLGSGTTALAAEQEGFAWIGIEKEAEYVAIAEARLNGTQRGMAL